MARKPVKGGGRLRKKFRRMPEQMRKPVRRENERTGQLLEFHMKRDAPRLTGDLAAAAHHQVSRDGLGVVAGYSPKRAGFKRKWKEGGYKALWAEFGTKYMRAQPFISRAFLDNIDALKRNYRRAVSAGLRRAIRG